MKQPLQGPLVFNLHDNTLNNTSVCSKAHVHLLNLATKALEVGLTVQEGQVLADTLVLSFK